MSGVGSCCCFTCFCLSPNLFPPPPPKCGTSGSRTVDECCEQAKAARHRGSCPRWYACTFPPPQYRFTCCTREKGVAHGAMSHTQETNTIYGTLLHFGSLFFFSLIINRRTALWRPVTRWTRDSSTSCWPRRGVASPQSSVDASPLSPLVFPAFSSKWPPASSCPGMILGKQPGAAAIQQSKHALSSPRTCGVFTILV